MCCSHSTPVCGNTSHTFEKLWQICLYHNILCSSQFSQWYPKNFLVPVFLCLSEISVFTARGLRWIIQCFNTQLVATALTRAPSPEKHPVITAAPSVVREQHFSNGVCFSVMNSLSLPNTCSAVVFTSKFRKHKYSSTVLYESISRILVYTSNCALFPISVDLGSCSP